MRWYQRILSVFLIGLIGCFVIGGYGWAIAAPLPINAAPATERLLFEAHCAACHANGGNIIRRGKTLKQKALLRNGYDSTDEIAALIKQGKGAMPAYADRLSEDEIAAIAQYVLTQAQAGW